MAFPSVEHQFKPGKSGNPAGRPTGRHSLSVVIRDLLEEPLDFGTLDVQNAAELATRYKGRTAWQALVLALFARALGGDVRAASWLSQSAYQLVASNPEAEVAPLTEETAQEIERELKLYREGESDG